MTETHQWNPEYPSLSPIFDSLGPVNDKFTHFNHWPDLSDYQKAFCESSLGITPVAQSQHFETFEDQYEPRIYLKGELQTRLENWHDFFNALVWLRFPQTKSILNKLHYQQSRLRKPGTNRSTLENRITQFDECGAIILSDNDNYLDMVRNHQWHELFVNNKQAFDKHIRCIVFGHAIFEKALDPYAGMTCHCILINNKEALEYSNNNMSVVDQCIADHWISELQQNHGKFAPYPVLGTPGYWPKQDEEFFANSSYFR